ncbi:MAG: Ldh family oxidoreductase, partial [Segetibacter sp.]|nr:Ldh family oxidoreductase [Segetibacter sp.]
ERVYIPGDVEREVAQERMKDGIPLIKPVIDDLLQLSDKYNIPL